MTFKFLSPAIHGLLDYAAALALIVLPFLLPFDGAPAAAVWLSVAAGVGLIGYSLLTDYAFGPFRLLSFRVHLLLDLAAALVFVAAPFVMGWQGLVLGYYLVMGSGVIAVVALSRNDASQGATQPASRESTSEASPRVIGSTWR